MRVRFYYSSADTPFNVPSNKGFRLDEVLNALKELAEQGKITYDVVDTSKLSPLELHEAYSTAVWPSVAKGYKGYNVSRCFGGRRSRGKNFGREVPALLVYQEGTENPEDVYPHRMGEATITIREFLDSLV